jgi:hypothetical protein
MGLKNAKEETRKMNVSSLQDEVCVHKLGFLMVCLPNCQHFPGFSTESPIFQKTP